MSTTLTVRVMQEIKGNRIEIITLTRRDEIYSSDLQRIVTDFMTSDTEKVEIIFLRKVEDAASEL